MPIGSGQKLCRLEIFISPASIASRMPGSRLMRVPWLNSAYSKPRSRISRNMARPSVWRWEFQQVEKEYMIPDELADLLRAGQTGSIRIARAAKPHSYATVLAVSKERF